MRDADRRRCDSARHRGANRRPARFRSGRERLRTGPGVGVPPDLWLETGTPLDVPRELTRVVVAPHGRGRNDRDRAGPPRAAGAGAPERLRAVAQDTRLCGDAARRSARRGRRLRDRSGDSRFFATGWYAEERGPDGRHVRWMREHGAVLVPSSRVPHGVTISMRASPPSTGAVNDAPLLSLRVNDVYDALTLPMSAGAARLRMDDPREAWVGGDQRAAVQRVADAAERRHRRRRARPRARTTVGDAAVALLDGEELDVEDERRVRPGLDRSRSRRRPVRAGARDGGVRRRACQRRPRSQPAMTCLAPRINGNGPRPALVSNCVPFAVGSRGL